MRINAEANVKNSTRFSMVYITGWSDVHRLEYVGLTDDTEPAAREKQALVDPTYRFEQRRFNRCSNIGWSDKNLNQRQFSCPERHTNKLREHRLIRRGKAQSSMHRWKQNDNAGWTDVEATETLTTTPVQYTRNPKTRILAKLWSPVDPLASAGSTGDRKELLVPRNNFPARVLGKTRWTMGQIKSKSHQIL